MDNKKPGKSRIIIVSNRLPFILKKTKEGKIEVKKGAGGLVTAMEPILKNRDDTWVGWPGYVQEEDSDGSMLSAIQSATSGYNIKPVIISSDELKNYYEGFANSIVWPLFHDSTDKCIFLPEYWKSYNSVNNKFALAVSQNVDDLDFLWVHDYQLILVGDQLRKKHIKNKIGFFLHIPFPPIDTFARCPWRHELLSAMSQYDILGFQTIQDKHNFIGCLEKIIPDVGINLKAELNEAVTKFKFGDRLVSIGVFPISIDFHEFSRKAKEHKVGKRAKEMRRNSRGVKFLLGVDRLDYTKGIPEKLMAFQMFLRLFPQFHKKAHFIQLVVPSRREITAYADLKHKIEQLVGEINGEFATNDWLPVQYMFRTLDRNELILLYRMCEVAYITSLKDGMNLVSKEYCACNINESGILMLSEFAGASHQFNKDAILINPHDTEGTARQIYRALKMPLEERKQRMHNLRENVRHNDIFWWVNSFLNAAIEKTLSNFPQVDDSCPAHCSNRHRSKFSRQAKRSNTTQP